MCKRLEYLNEGTPLCFKMCVPRGLKQQNDCWQLIDMDGSSKLALSKPVVIYQSTDSFKRFANDKLPKFGESNPILGIAVCSIFCSDYLVYGFSTTTDHEANVELLEPYFFLTSRFD